MITINKGSRIPGIYNVLKFSPIVRYSDRTRGDMSECLGLSAILFPGFICGRRIYQEQDSTGGGPKGVSEILKEAMSLPWRNGKRMLPVILLVVVPFSLLVLLHSLTMGPFMAEIEDGEFSFARHNVAVLVFAEMIFLVSFVILLFFSMVVTIHCSAGIYTGESVSSLREMFAQIGRKWNRPAVTFLWVVLAAAGYVTSMAALLTASAVILSGPAVSALIGLVGFMGTLFFLSLAVVWMLALVLSVVEEDCYGMRALARAAELVRGRRLQGFALMLLVGLSSAPIFVIFSVNIFEDELSMWIHVVAGAIVTALLCLMNLFTFVVFTVFYYTCKVKHGREDLEVEAACRLVSGDPGSDGSHP